MAGKGPHIKSYPFESGVRSGIFLYYNGSATGKPGEIVVIPKKIDLSHFFVEDSIDEEIFTFAPEAQNRKPEIDLAGDDRNATEDFTVSSEIRSGQGSLSCL